MINYNVIIVFNKEEDKILMCKRRKDPYKGLFNFVGGKIEVDETSQQGAYRELFEETGISDKDITLTHMMDYCYYIDPCNIEVYVGKLNKDFQVYGDENELHWLSPNENFYDDSIFAGEGNIAHMLNIIKSYKEKLLI